MVVLLIVNPFLALAYKDSDFLIGVEINSGRKPLSPIDDDADDDLLLLHDDEDGGNAPTGRPMMLSNRIERILEQVFGNNRLGLNPRMVVSFGVAALLSLLKQKLDSSSRLSNSTRKPTKVDNNWKTLYESVVAKTEVDRAELEAQLHQSQERAAHWESMATNAKSRHEKMQSNLDNAREEAARVAANASTQQRALEAELQQVKDQLQAQGTGGDDSLRIELERAKKLLFKMKSDKEKAAAEKAEQRTLSAADKDGIEAQAQKIQQSLQVDLEKAQERASYWEARSKQEATQHSQLISQLCGEMKNIMVEEKRRLQQEFQKETDLLRQKLVSGLSETKG